MAKWVLPLNIVLSLLIIAVIALMTGQWALLPIIGVIPFSEALSGMLGQAGFTVHCHRLVPPNDGGLALGQAVIAGRSHPCA